MILFEKTLVKKKILQSSFIVVSGMIIGACASTTTKSEVSEQVKTATTAETPAIPQNRVLPASAQTEQVDWLSSFNDPVLLKLVQEARSNNKNLQAAAANVERSLALVKQAGASLKPTVNLGVNRSASGDNQSSTPNQNAQGINLQFNWEVDMWGRLRSGQQAALASAEAATADFRYSQHSLSAAVVKAYLTAIEATLQADIAKENLKALTETLRIVKVKYDNGQSSAQDLALTRSDLANANDSIITIDASKREALRALEVLLGRYPSAELKTSLQLPDVPPLPRNAIPSDLLERRPDIVAAERNVAAAFNATEQARVAKLPSLSLSGSLGGSSNSLSSILDPANIAWQLAGSLLAPLFDGGARQAQVEAANAEQKQAIAAYAQSALTAFQDVEGALDQGTVLANREIELLNAQKESDKALRIAQLNYREGEIELLDVLTIQQRSNSARSNYLSVKRLVLEQRVNLHLALGGDWN